MRHYSKNIKSEWSLPSLNAPVGLGSPAVIRFCEYIKSVPNLAELAKNKTGLDERILSKADRETLLLLEKELRTYLDKNLTKFSQQVIKLSVNQQSDCFTFVYDLSRKMPGLKGSAYPVLQKIIDLEVSLNSGNLISQFLRRNMPLELRRKAESRIVQFFALNPDIKLIASDKFNFLSYIKKDSVSSRMLIAAFESYVIRNRRHISSVLKESDKLIKDSVCKLLIEVCMLADQNKAVFSDYLYHHRYLLIRQFNNPDSAHDILWMAKAVAAVMSTAKKWSDMDRQFMIGPWNKFCDELRRRLLDYDGSNNHPALKIADSFFEDNYTTSTKSAISSLMSFLIFGKERVDANTFTASAVKTFNFSWVKSSMTNDPISWIVKNLKCMAEIEQSRPGSLLELYTDYGIINFARYGKQNLLNQLENVQLDKKTIFFISTYDDWNGAFSDRQELVEYLSSRAEDNDRQLVIAEVGFVENLTELIPRLSHNKKRYVDAIIFNDHFGPGYSTLHSERSINFPITYTQLKPELYMGAIFQRIGEYMLEHGQITLLGCRTADDNYSLACALSELLPDIYVEGMRFNDNASYVEIDEDRYLHTISSYYKTARAVRWYQAGYLIEQ